MEAYAVGATHHEVFRLFAMTRQGNPAPQGLWEAADHHRLQGPEEMFL